MNFTFGPPGSRPTPLLAGRYCIGRFSLYCQPGNMRFHETITVVGGNLSTISTHQLGDATQAWRIAALNGLSDPMVIGQVTLVIPDANASQTGGLSILTPV